MGDAVRSLRILLGMEGFDSAFSGASRETNQHPCFVLLCPLRTLRGAPGSSIFVLRVLPSDVTRQAKEEQNRIIEWDLASTIMVEQATEEGLSAPLEVQGHLEVDTTIYHYQGSARYIICGAGHNRDECDSRSIRKCWTKGCKRAIEGTTTQRIIMDKHDKLLKGGSLS